MNRNEILEMLNIENGSEEYFKLLSRAYEMSKKNYKKGYVFAQIGLNAQPCSANCKFCSFGEKHFSAETELQKSKENIIVEARRFISQDVDALFLMATADYPMDLFFEISKEVKAMMPEEMEFVCNIRDFDFDTAKKLRDIGYTASYHICRLGEGKDTDLSLEERKNTLEALTKADLSLFYCVEPIGPEHSYEEIADEIERAIEYEVDVMAIMRRNPIEGTPKFAEGAIDMLEFTKIAAATRIAVDPKKSMNAHETNAMTFLAGVNQLYAESGTNPRDVKIKTEAARGLSVEDCRKLLKDAKYQC